MKDVHMVYAGGCCAEQGGFGGCVECGGWGGEFGDEQVEDYASQAGHSEVVEWVKKDDGAGVAVDVGDQRVCWWEDGLGDDEVEEGGFARAGWVVAGWWRDELEDCWRRRRE